jgi:serine/threonine protein kinase
MSQFINKLRIFKENGLWAILRQISSALAKCHHGLNAKLSSEGMEEFYSFDEVCKPVIHRDIKSSNS